MAMSATAAATARLTWRRRSWKRGGGGLARPVTTVKVVALVVVDFAGVIEPLPFEVLSRPGVGSIELLARGVQLVGQVVSPALLDSGLDQPPSNRCRVSLAIGVQPHVAHMDDGKGLPVRRVGEQRRGIGRYVAHRRAQHVQL